MTTNDLFRKALQSEFTKRAKRNSAYSVRSFALSLEVEPSSLAQILSGKRKLTDKMCARLGTKLGFSPLKVRALTGRRDVTKPFKAFDKLNEDAFMVVADWYYYAILELTHCHGFQGKIKWVSQVLGISFAETVEAVERLKRLNYLEITLEGTWIDRLGDANNLGNEFKAPAFTEHQRQVLSKAKEALEKVPYAKRVQSSMTLACSREKVPEAKAMILNFMEELDEFLRSGPKTDEVVIFSASLFPISQINPGEDYV